MANIGFDHFNKFILHDEIDTAIDIIETYSEAKDEEDFLHISMTTDVIMTASGKDDLGGGKFTGVTVVLKNGWTFKSRTVPAVGTKIKISGGNTIAESGNELFTNVEKIHYEFDQSTSPALITAGGGSSGGVNFFRSLDR